MTVIRNGELRFRSLPGRTSADPLDGLRATSSVRVVRLDGARTRHAHRHPHSEEIVYVRSGRGTAFVDGTPHPVEPGDVVHIPAGAPHATVPDAGEQVELVCFFPHPDLTQNLEETDIELTTEERP